MSRVCPDCPGSHGCCVTENLLDDDFDDDMRSWDEWFWEVGFNIIMWTILISIAIGISGLAFAAGCWGYVTGLGLLWPK